MDKRRFVLSHAQRLLTVGMITCGFYTVEAAEPCDVTAKKVFLELYELRKIDPLQVSEKDYQEAARNFIDANEQCYEATSRVKDDGTVLNRLATAPIDAGGIWIDAGSDHTSSEYNLLGTKWGPDSPFVNELPRSAGGLVTYSYMPSGTPVAGLEIADLGIPPDDITSIQDLPTYEPCFAAEITLSFAAWSAVSNITFVEVADNGLAFNEAGASGDIRIGAHTFDGYSGVLEHAFYPPPNGVSGAGDIHFDIHESWNCDGSLTGGGVDFGVVALHAIGHTIGLQHESYNPSVMLPTYDPSHVELFLDDQVGAQALYGEPEDEETKDKFDLESFLVYGGGVKTFLGEPMNIGIRLINLSDNALGNIELRFFQSVDKTISLSDLQIGMVTVAKLGSGNLSDILEYSHQVNAVGSYYIGACVVHALDGNTANDCSIGARFDVIDVSSVQLPTTSVDISTAGSLDGDKLSKANFGQSASAFGKRIVLGAPGSKVAYIYGRASGIWGLEGKLTVKDPKFDFGSTVLLVGNNAFVANKSDSAVVSFSGAVYSFEESIQNGWKLAQVIKSPFPASFEYFGTSMDSDGEILVIGAPGVSLDGVPAGSVYVYAKSPEGIWVFQYRIQASDGFSGDRHGLSLAYEDGVLAVGAKGSAAGVVEAGKVYLYALNSAGWSSLKTFQLPDAVIGDHFGHSLDLNGGVLAIGSPSRDALYTGSGAVYVFMAADGWNTQVELLPNIATTPFAFGQSIKIQGGIIYIASAGRPGGIFPYVFRDQSWQPEPPLLGDDISASGGYSVGASENYLVMGIGTDSLEASLAGTAYIYDITTGTAEEVLFGIRVTSLPGGQVEINGGQTCLAGQVCQIDAYFGDRITLVARPDAGYLFGGWQGGCSREGLVCEKVVTGSEDLSAIFYAQPVDGNCTSRIENIHLAGLTNVNGCALVRHYQAGHCIEFAGVKMTDETRLVISAPKITFKDGVSMVSGTRIQTRNVAQTGDDNYTVTLTEECF